jgi:hypothetical protein
VGSYESASSAPVSARPMCGAFTAHPSRRRPPQQLCRSLRRRRLDDLAHARCDCCDWIVCPSSASAAAARGRRGLVVRRGPSLSPLRIVVQHWRGLSSTTEPLCSATAASAASTWCSRAPVPIEHDPGQAEHRMQCRWQCAMLNSLRLGGALADRLGRDALRIGCCPADRLEPEPLLPAFQAPVSPMVCW